jgi:hypothetical protein
MRRAEAPKFKGKSGACGKKTAGFSVRGGFFGIGRALKKFLGLDYQAPVMMNVAPARSAPDATESSESVSNAKLRKRKLLASATKTELTDSSRAASGSGKQRTLG